MWSHIERLNLFASRQGEVTDIRINLQTNISSKRLYRPRDRLSENEQPVAVVGTNEN